MMKLLKGLFAKKIVNCKECGKHLKRKYQDHSGYCERCFAALKEQPYTQCMVKCRKCGTVLGNSFEDHDGFCLKCKLGFVCNHCCREGHVRVNDELLCAECDKLVKCKRCKNPVEESFEGYCEFCFHEVNRKNTPA